MISTIQRSFACLILAGLALIVLTGCVSHSFDNHDKKAMNMTNPASSHCIQLGGKLLIKQLPNGGQYGVCEFADNRQCEEWALYKGLCPKGGLKVTGYLTPAAVYCAITGGIYQITHKQKAVHDKEQGTCILHSGKKCDEEAYYNGQCTD